MKRFSTFIYEANLAGSTTNYQRSTGAFYKYVQMAKDPNIDFEADRDAKLYDKQFNHVADISQGEKFKILDRDEKDLQMMKQSYTTRIKFKGQEYQMRLSDILKPSGKKVDFIQVDLHSKIDPSVWVPFKAGHGHEAQIAQVFIEKSGGNWEFEHKGKEYHITKLMSPPTPKGIGGNPKTDLYVRFAESIPGFGRELKYSLKAANATFIENWMKPERLEQIFGKSKSIAIITDTHRRLNEDASKVVGKSKAPTLHWFVVDSKLTRPNTDIFLDKKEATEAFSGAKKFGERHPATANCWLKGDPTNSISTLIDKTQDINKHGVKASLFIRGYGKAGKSACYIRTEDGWRINDNWIKYFRLDKSYGRA